MNLLITMECNLACPYCFAGSLQKKVGGREMTLAEIDMIISSLDPAKRPVRLMGGEPTLHSKYPKILQSLKARGFEVVVFTNGTQNALRCTAPAFPDRILLNLNEPGFYSPSQRNEIRKNLIALGDRVELGYTIAQAKFDLGWHRQLILDKGLRAMVRLGLAQPVIGGDNVYLADADLPEAHASVVCWAKRLSKDGIRLSLDCGFMRCHFSDLDIGDLIRAGTVLRFACTPTVDVGPGLETWRCYAFSNQKGLNWLGFEGEEDCLEWFAGMDTTHQEGCAQCQHLESGWCQGGCKARSPSQA